MRVIGFFFWDVVLVFVLVLEVNLVFYDNKWVLEFGCGVIVFSFLIVLNFVVIVFVIDGDFVSMSFF